MLPQSRPTTLKSALILLLLFCVSSFAANNKAERHRAEQILNLVSKDVQNNFYDPTLKGLDWPALTEQARQRIRSAEEMGEMHGAISALLYQLHDSHTVFIPRKRNFRAVYGFKAQPFADDILVSQIDKDGPAAKAGLKLGDRLLGVNNLNAVRNSFFDMMRYLTVLDPQEDLRLEVLQDGYPREIKVSAKIIPEPPQYFFELVEADRDRDTDQPFYEFKDYKDGISYLKIRTFFVDPIGVKGVAKPLANSRAAILDLRGNGGGVLESVLDIMGQFVNEGFEIAQSVSRKKSESVRVKPLSPHITCPLVILIDSRSASGSELFARAMQIHKRGVVIGDRSIGHLNAARFFWQPPGAA